MHIRQLAAHATSTQMNNREGLLESPCLLPLQSLPYTPRISRTTVPGWGNIKPMQSDESRPKRSGRAWRGSRGKGSHEVPPSGNGLCVLCSVSFRTMRMVVATAPQKNPFPLKQNSVWVFSSSSQNSQRLFCLLSYRCYNNFYWWWQKQFPFIHCLLGETVQRTYTPYPGCSESDKEPTRHPVL